MMRMTLEENEGGRLFEAREQRRREKRGYEREVLVDESQRSVLELSGEDLEKKEVRQ